MRKRDPKTGRFTKPYTDEDLKRWASFIRDGAPRFEVIIEIMRDMECSAEFGAKYYRKAKAQAETTIDDHS